MKQNIENYIELDFLKPMHMNVCHQTSAEVTLDFIENKIFETIF